MLREKLHNPRIYARLCLSLQNKFESKYALTLWELCTDYLGSKRDYGETPWIKIDDFRNLMGIGKNEYRAFRDVNKRIICQPIAEINRLSDFRVTVDYQHTGRKVTALKFKMRRVVLLPEPENTQAKLFPEMEDMPVIVRELKDAGVGTQDAWEIWQQGFDYVNEGTRLAGPSEDAEVAFLHYIREKIHLLKRRQASGKVENSTGFLLNQNGRLGNPEMLGAANPTDDSMSASLFPLLSGQFSTPLDFFGVHTKLLLPSNPSLTVTGGEFQLVSFGAGSQDVFGIGPGVPRDIVPDSGSTLLLFGLTLLALPAIYRQTLIM